MTPQEMKASLARVLDGDALPAGIDPTAFVRLAIAQGIGPQLKEAAAARSLGGEAAELMAEDERLTLLHAALINDELRRVLARFAGAGVRVLVVKGAHLAHAVYDRPHLRVRSDSDLLIDVADRDAIGRVLRDAGYGRSVHVRGRVILGQFHMERHDRAGVTHALDIHWRVAAPLLVERLLPARLVLASAAPLPALGPDAWAPALPHALAFACLHLAAHHWPAADLLWLYDLRLLAEALTARQRAAFIELTASGGFETLARHVLQRAGAAFQSRAIDGLTGVLAENPSEPALALLSRRRAFDDLRLDLRYASAGQRLSLVREHLFPDPGYMRASGNGALLPAAYARRIARGAKRWLVRDRSL